MRMVLQIAKAELRNLFYSPVAWFLMVAFLVQCGYFYTEVLHTNANWQDIAIKNNPKWKEWEHTSFTRILFLGEDGMFGNVIRNLYLFVPLLTMGLIGKELQAGTIKLLYSAPVKLRQIVIGKYLAILAYNVLLVLIVGIFLVSAMISVRDVDYGMLLSAALGFFLITSAYTAIGTFMSSITTYQVVAAIGTFMIIFCLSIIGGLWQKYDLIRDLTYFLFLSGRTEKMLVGLITTKDVIYFLVIIAMFLAFTLLKLRAAREVKPWYVKMLRYCMVVTVCLAVGYISSRPMLTGYWDTTQQDVNTIHEKTQKIIKDMGKDELEVTLYTNLFGSGMSAGLPQSRNYYLTSLWEQYLRFKPDIKFKYEYYYDYDSTIQGPGLYRAWPGKNLDQMAAKMTDMYEEDLDYWTKPEEMKKKIDLRPEKLRSVMQLKYKGRTEFLRTFDDNVFWPEEMQVAAAFKRLTDPNYPRVAFVTGHYERNIDKKGEREFRKHTAGKEERGAMVNLGFDVDTINLDHDEIPDNLRTLVLADPKSALSETCLGKIKQYIDKGGNLFVLGEPGKQQMVNPVLEQLGVKLMNGSVLVQSSQEAQDMIEPFFTDEAFGLMKDPKSAVLKPLSGHDDHVLMPGAAAIEHRNATGYTITSLLKPIPVYSWIRERPFVRDSVKVPFDSLAGDIRVVPTGGGHGGEVTKNYTGPDFATAITMQRNINNRDQRIVITGDADFTSNERYSGHKYAISFQSWLSGGEYPVIIRRPAPPDNLLLITGNTAYAKKIIFIYVLPGMLLVAAAILLIRRKRK